MTGEFNPVNSSKLNKNGRIELRQLKWNKINRRLSNATKNLFCATEIFKTRRTFKVCTREGEAGRGPDWEGGGGLSGCSQRPISLTTVGQANVLWASPRSNN